MKKQNGENKNYVLDSTAFLALFEDEPGAETVQELLILLLPTNPLNPVDPV